MIENLKQFSCGGCGCKDYNIFARGKSDEIILECKKCKSITAISATTPSLEISQIPGCVSNGIPCFLNNN